MSNIPTEIWMQILAYLPVISLLRFRSVNKVWKFIIEEPYFSSLHLQRCLNNALEASLLVKLLNLNTGQYKWVLHCSETFQEMSNLFDFPVDKSQCEGEEKGKWECVSARDGLILQQKSPGCWGRGEVKLWNPSINKSIEIDPPSLTRLPSWYDCSPDNHYEAFIGFDPSSNDYKVVSFVTQPRWRKPYAIRPFFYVYSLKDGLWEEVSCNGAANKYMSGRKYMTYCTATNNHYDHKVSVGEFIHWIETEMVGDSDELCLVSLNLTTRTISFTSLLDHVWDLRCPYVSGSSFLGVLVEGIHKSCAKWSKMKDNLDSGYYHIRMDGRILLLANTYVLFMYDFKTGYKKVLNRLDEEIYPCYINSHIESLVLLDR